MTAPAGRRWVGIAVLAVLAAGLGVLRLTIDRPPGEAGSLRLAWPAPEWAAFRWTAVTVALIVGAALAVSGVLLQALLRSPLASPFILGLSSGAGLGVAAAMFIASAAGAPLLGAGSTMLPALLGALGSLMVVYILGQRRGWIDPVSLVLMGVVVATICGALTLFLQYLSPGGMREDLLRWMFGRIPQGESPATLAITGAVTVVAIVASVFLGRAMDAATLGEDEARSIGLAIGRLRLVMFFIAGALAATAVTLAGPIGFVGIIAPHAARLIIGPRHALLVVGSALCGMIVLLAADVASQLIYLRTGRMPVGVFTALLGGPAFIWLLRSGRGQS